jgi:hypothetical protein
MGWSASCDVFKALAQTGRKRQLASRYARTSLKNYQLTKPHVKTFAMLSS